MQAQQMQEVNADLKVKDLRGTVAGEAVENHPEVEAMWNSRPAASRKHGDSECLGSRNDDRLSIV